MVIFYHYLVESVTSVDFSITCCDNDDNDEDQTGPGSEDLHTSKSFTKGRNLFRKHERQSAERTLLFLKTLASYSQKSYCDCHYI